MFRFRSTLFPLLLAAAVSDCRDSGPAALESTPDLAQYAPHRRIYYVAAQNVDWDYAPLGTDASFGQPLPSPWGDTTVYPKRRYVQYADSTFTTPVPQPQWQGILGPMLRAVVGDTMTVVFRNLSDMAASMHPHGVRYDPANEGAVYDPPRGGGDSVPPGGTWTYTWRAVKESGPLPGEPSSKVWLYHSHVHAEEDIYAGLIGTIVVTDLSRARADGAPVDVDREFTTLWMVFNENTPDTPPEEEETHLKHSINGLFFGNLQGLTMNLGDRVRWYLVALGTEVDLHTPHWHGETIKLEGRTYTDVVELLPASMHVGDMVADNPGTWLLHCHVGDHMMAGMYTTFTIGNPGAVASRTPGADVGPGWMPFHDRATGMTHQH